MKTLGIIGFGQFGEFMAKHLSEHFDVSIYARREESRQDAQKKGFSVGTLEEICSSDILAPSIPVQYLETLLKQISSLITPETLVVDVASVKVKPVKLYEEYLAKDVPFLITHPMFGPQSGKNGIEGLNIALCQHDRSNGFYEEAKLFFGETLKLNVLEITAEEHDKNMTYVQVLPHLVARAMDMLELPKVPYGTKAYDHLIEIRDLLAGDSKELFFTLQNENPYAEDMREKFHQTLDDLEQVIKKDSLE